MNMTAGEVGVPEPLVLLQRHSLNANEGIVDFQQTRDLPAVSN